MGSEKWEGRDLTLPLPFVLMSDWFGPTGQGKLLESTSHEEKVFFFFEDVGHKGVATG